MIEVTAEALDLIGVVLGRLKSGQLDRADLTFQLPGVEISVSFYSSPLDMPEEAKVEPGPEERAAARVEKQVEAISKAVRSEHGPVPVVLGEPLTRVLLDRIVAAGNSGVGILLLPDGVAIDRDRLRAGASNDG